MVTKSVLIVVSLFLAVAVNDALPMKDFNVIHYGAVGNNKVNNTQAFLDAWSDACAYPGRGRVLIPQGQFLVYSVTFSGSCNGSMTFLIDGNLIAPKDPKYFTQSWIKFQYLENLTVKGGGTLDGQGISAWKYNDCNKNKDCKPLDTSLWFDFVNNSSIYNIISLNSKNTHIKLFACQNMNISHVRLRAPADSPNTDGIKIGMSKNIVISNSVLATGDDCVAILPGTKNVSISEVECGPGHGISIGSIGKGPHADHVEGISVKNCTFIGTDNGLRIKTWAPSDYNLVYNVNYEDILMKQVNNPIVIDQQYCPSSSCEIADSSVQIENVTYKNIWGISRTKAAVQIKCSGVNPCKNVKLINIHLAYNGHNGSAESMCSNVAGSSEGRQIPGGCL